MRERVVEVPALQAQRRQLAAELELFPPADQRAVAGDVAAGVGRVDLVREVEDADVDQADTAARKLQLDVMDEAAGVLAGMTRSKL